MRVLGEYRLTSDNDGLVIDELRGGANHVLEGFAIRQCTILDSSGESASFLFRERAGEGGGLPQLAGVWSVGADRSRDACPWHGQNPLPLVRPAGIDSLFLAPAGQTPPRLIEKAIV